MTLTELSYYSRKFTPLGIIGILIFLIIYFSIRVITSIPSDPVAPTPGVVMTFGKIKEPILPDASSSAGLTFSIDTLEGRPITPAEEGKVFFIPQTNTQVGYRFVVNKMAEIVGIDPDKSVRDTTDSAVIFSDSTQKLMVDIRNFNFSYQYQIGPTDEFFATAVVPPEKDITNRAIDFLRAVGRYPDELSRGRTSVLYHTYDRGTQSLSVASDSAHANIVEVDFYREETEKLPTVSTQYFNSPHHVVGVFHEKGFKVIRAQVQFYEKSKEQNGVYALKTGDAAYDELKAGKGIVIARPTLSTNVTIHKMYLAYFDPDVYQEYLQPVYVFEGGKDDPFVGYIQAVDNSKAGP